GATATHPFWSLDRQAFVPAGDLTVGERIATLRGETHVVSMTPHGAPETVYNLEVWGEHVYHVGRLAALVHNNSCGGKSPKRTKRGGTLTEPNLPPKTVVRDGQVEVVNLYRSGEHAPAHLHVKGGGPTARIGQAGRPLKGSLTSIQRKAVERHKSKIRKAVDQIQRWWRYENADG
ncbi:MAG: hypothetical protein GY842_27855, partial [bacterium]|nr:hypothetical protein [bacterium]